MLTKEDEFKQMCQCHDLTYGYSDDITAYRKGQMSFAEIYDYINSGEINKGVAIKIWNSVVDEKIISSAREPYYLEEE